MHALWPIGWSDQSMMMVLMLILMKIKWESELKYKSESLPLALWPMRQRAPIPSVWELKKTLYFYIFLHTSSNTRWSCKQRKNLTRGSTPTVGSSRIRRRGEWRSATWRSWRWWDAWWSAMWRVDVLPQVRVVFVDLHSGSAPKKNIIAIIVIITIATILWLHHHHHHRNSFITRNLSILERQLKQLKKFKPRNIRSDFLRFRSWRYSSIDVEGEKKEKHLRIVTFFWVRRRSRPK